MAAQNLAMDSFWVDKTKYDECENQYFELLAKALLTPLADEVAKARQRLIEIRENMDDELLAGNSSPQPLLITDFLDCSNLNTSEMVESTHIVDSGDNKMAPIETQTLMFIEEKMSDITRIIVNFQDQMTKFNDRLVAMENMIKAGSGANVCPAPKPIAEQEDDMDLFDSDSNSEDDEALEQLKQDRLKAYNTKKSKKPALIAKSSIILDVKPWDDETDMKLLEGEVRKIVMDGLLWGASKLVPLAYGIHKLQINCVVEDEKVSIDLLQEQIENIEDYVQSVDIAAFNKI